MRDLIQRLDTWRQQRSSDALTIPPGATEQEIHEVETALGVRLPEDLRTAFALRNPFWLPLSHEMQTIQEVGELWNLYCGVWTTEAWGNGSIATGPVRPDWWNPRWIPITFNQGHSYFVDLDPAPGGQIGQIVSYDCGNPRVQLIDPRTEVVAVCFRGWVEKLASDLERGTISR